MDLAPPEAQLEVGQTQPASKAAASESAAAGANDSEVDNIFADHAPAEAAQEVNEFALEGSTTGGISQNAELSQELSSLTDGAEEEDGEAPSSLFDGGLDSEIDDIFSELAPPEAQKEVKDVFSSASSMETASRPAVEAPKVESFAPETAAEASSPDQVGAEARADGEEEEASEEAGLFDESLDQELDSVFPRRDRGPPVRS